MDVAEPYVVQQLQLLGDPALVGEELERVGHGQIQHVGGGDIALRQTMTAWTRS